MAFGKMGIRAWSKEWRQSDWRETIPLASGRECPKCLATVCGGKSWRGHWSKHDEDEDRLEEMHQQLVALSKAMRHLAIEAGHGDWYGVEEEAEAVPVLGGRVIGNGPLPEEMRGGGE